MEILPGFVFLPRPAGNPRPAGAFFSAVVEAKTGPQTWRVLIDGQSQIVSTTLDLVPGQTLRLRLGSVQGDRWIFQALDTPTPGRPRGLTGEPSNPLVAAFLSRGLPAVSETLARWSRWAARIPGPSDKEGWAASLEARGSGPVGPLAEGLAPWLAWQAVLEAGRSDPPPGDPEFWDLWNLRRPDVGDLWLTLPLRWSWEGGEDAGLLQAHWNPPAQRIDLWNLTAAPGQVPFRLEARQTPGTLSLTWRFFREADARLWKTRTSALESLLDTPDLKVRLEVTEAGAVLPSPSLGGVDVEI